MPSGNLGHGTVDIEADVADAEAVRAAVEGCQGVLHAAARHAPHAAHFHAKEFVATNVTGTQNVLDAAVAVGGIPVVYSSTTSLTITNRGAIQLNLKSLSLTFGLKINLSYWL